MKHVIIDSLLLRDMLTNGFKELLNQKEYVNNLNVFPVPDGDTGLNMSKTFQGGVDSLIEADTVGGCLKSFARGALLAARGNSGVILSQFLRGFTKDTEDLDNFTIDTFIDAIANGREQAYASVVNPTEGTMLTLMTDAMNTLRENRASFNDFEDLFKALLIELEMSLKRTPSLLDVLAEAGVVDSGGAGLLAIFKGMAMAIDGELLDDIVIPEESTSTAIGMLDENDTNVFGYCTEFILQLFNNKIDVASFSVDKFIEDLTELGDSIVAVQDDIIVKVHIHTKTPEVVLAFAHKYGEFLTLKIENMTVQHNEVIAQSEAAEKMPDHKDYAVIAVASGEGIIDFFKLIGADVIIDGGQTNNPSTEDFVNAIKKVNADHIVLLPNNSNIILTAEQAAKMFDDMDIRVIKTKSIAEGYSCLSMMDQGADDIDRFITSMSSSLDNVVTGLVTTATRDTVIDGVDIKKDKYIGIGDKTIYTCDDNKVDCAYNLIKSIPDIDSKDVLTIFQGANVTDEEIEEFQDRVSSDYPLMEIGVVPGGQDVYDLIMAIE
ncbi:MAG: DAK2 domain-containing protein [Clostridia bacterium]|nr:DAK2 domain-containing protein [Clostridia bacterium]